MTRSPSALRRLTACASVAALLATASIGARSETIACAETTLVITADADAWIYENVPSANFATDGILNVDGGSPVDPDLPAPTGRTRSVVRFPVPSGTPEGCVVQSARLRLYSPEDQAGIRVEAVAAASAWAESGITWDNQPATVGEAAVTWSRGGYMQWNVASQVAAMLAGANHGFVLRDAAELSDMSGGHGFHSREKGNDPPQLVIRFAAPAEETGTPAPPAAAAVSCGDVITESTLLTADLLDCPGDGLIIGASRIIVDLNDHLVDGVGLGTGIFNDGYTLVTVRNGTIREFDYGVELIGRAGANVVTRVRLEGNEIAGVQLFDAAPGNEIIGNALSNNGAGVAMVSGTTRAKVVGNTMDLHRGAGMLLRHSRENWIEANTISGGGDLGVGLEHAERNTLLNNVVSSNSDGGIELRDGSNDNLLERNRLIASGDTGILVEASDRNWLIANSTRSMSDSGITLNSANDGVVRDNDLQLSPGGLQMDGSSRNLVSGNNASRSTGIGIELGGGSLGNIVSFNVASRNGAMGFYVADDAPEQGNLLHGNLAAGNGSDGITAAKGGHTLSNNVVFDNSGWGISGAPGIIDGGGNTASGNKEPAQCLGIVCAAATVADTTPPETTIISAPLATTSETSATFTFGTSEAEATFQCSLDGAAFSACAAPQVYGGLSLGVHTFAVTSMDAAGNLDPTAARYGWTIVPPPDLTPPDTTILSGPAATTTATTASISFAASDAGATFRCSLDGAAFTACASPVQLAQLGTGSHSFAVRATDAAGNTDPTPATQVWAVVAPALGPVDCGGPITLSAMADAWVDQNSSSSNKGTDSILKVVSKRDGNNARALVRFDMPAVPAGCGVASATLRLYAASAQAGRTLHALGAGSSWSETRVTWEDRPSTAGTAATAAAGTGYVEWNVTRLLVEMIGAATNHGFVIRDAEENADAEQQFHAREKDSQPPQLIVHLGPAGS